MNVNYNIIIDLTNNDRKHIIEAKQTDRSSRVMRFTVLDRNKPFDMANVVAASIKGIKPDSTIVYAAGEIEYDEEGKAKNSIIYTMSDHVTAVQGTISFEMQLRNPMHQGDCHGCLYQAMQILCP